MPEKKIRRHNRQNDSIVSTGYNGAPRGREIAAICASASESISESRGERYEMCRSVHAEANAIIAAARENMIGSTLYMACTDPADGK
ncbi:MAG: hypothetical protein ACLUFM_00830 [Lachnospiraceae bacterium]